MRESGEGERPNVVIQQKPIYNKYQPQSVMDRNRMGRKEEDRYLGAK